MSKLYDCDSTGHSTIEWTAENKEAMAAAEKRFNEIVNEEKRFVFDKATGRRLKEFDKNVDEMTAIPVVVGG